ncbi:MAG: hypothetical protein J7621_16905 [Niastella sp.]|nr:hypothetical protein [Niastella sp.]
MATNFHIAPPAKTVDGLPAVPIDIQHLSATIIFDGSTSTTSVDATIEYTVGPTAGNPFFDLRQTISQAWLDGAVFAPAQIALHDFGGGANTGLRIIESVQAAGSVHTLRVVYNLALPQSQLTGGYPPVIEWQPGPKLRFVFGLSDLNAGRYLEAWLPANLIFDQFTIQLTVQITNTLAAHAVITNAQVTNLGSNHWSLTFPARFTALSPMLEIRASDTLQLQTDTVALPVSGTVVTIEAWKPSGSATNLTTEINNIKSFLQDNENNYGAYVHGNRFVAFFNGVGGMEYEGGTTTSSGALLHETFHSWFARGVKPAGQADGWWDEAYTSFHDDGADDALPFDFTDPPILLCTRDPFQRRTPNNSYSDGNRFWQGMASLLGTSALNNSLREFYKYYKGNPASTAMLEEFLLTQHNNDQLVDAFHRFVYNLPNPSPAPDLWIKDNAPDPGGNFTDGAFWDSPDLWIRNQDDGLTTHQAPEYGQDNWFYARVRNKAATGTARHFVVTFNAKSFAGTEFVYPGDFLPCIAAKAEFDLGPGETRIVKARWPRSKVPPAGTHSCLLASVISRNDHPASGLHAWEHNNLAQKNLTIVNLQPDMFIIIPFVLINVLLGQEDRHELEIWRDSRVTDYPVSIVHPSKDFFSHHKGVKLVPLSIENNTHNHLHADDAQLECGAHLQDKGTAYKTKMLTSDNPELIRKRYPYALQAIMPKGKKATLTISLPVHNQTVAGLKVDVPPNAKKGEVFKTHIVQRHIKTKKITGGIAVEIHVR